MRASEGSRANARDSRSASARWTVQGGFRLGLYCEASPVAERTCVVFSLSFS